MFGREVSIIFVPTARCDCRCDHCFQPRTDDTITLEELSTVFQRISTYLAGVGVTNVDIYWQGGEIMTLSPEWPLQAGRRIDALFRGANLSARHFLQTNLMGYGPAWDSTLWELFDGMLGSSLDFPNVYRRYRGITGEAYNESWVARYREATSGGLHLSVISVPNKRTLDVSPLDFYRYYFDELGLKSVQLNTPFAAGPSRRLAGEISLDARPLGDFLADLFEVYCSRDDGVTLDPFKSVIDRLVFGDNAAKTPCFFCPNCVSSFFCVGPRGEIGQCDAWLGSYPENNFGNILESENLGDILVSPRRLELAARAENLIRNSECLECAYMSLCNGGCPVRAKSGKGDLNQSDPQCEAYKKMFEAVERHVRASPHLWNKWSASAPPEARSLLWGWSEPGAIVFSSFECNNNCIFCAPAHDRSKNPPDLDRQVFDFITECAQSGAKTLFFTGAGEPTLNPSLVDYARLAKDAGILELYLFTNGSGVTEKLVEALRRAGVENYWVSIHGIGETHDRIVRRKGSFVQAFRALSLINGSSPQRLNVNTCLNMLNVDEIERLMDKTLGFAKTTAHCLCLLEWDGNAYTNRDKMCRLPLLRDRLSSITPGRFPLTILDNVPHCVAPRLPHIGNSPDDLRIKRRNTEQMVSNRLNMGHNAIPQPCVEKGCPHLEVCVGVDRRYLEEYGNDEIITLIGRP
ncbi:MAG: radical SAM protein [Deltaproteobacteria bacterium]|nr:radical SAM protein [Deltaproteobacteria bacterium]